MATEEIYDNSLRNEENPLNKGDFGYGQENTENRAGFQEGVETNNPNPENGEYTEVQAENPGSHNLEQPDQEGPEAVDEQTGEIIEQIEEKAEAGEGLTDEETNTLQLTEENLESILPDLVVDEADASEIMDQANELGRLNKILRGE